MPIMGKTRVGSPRSKPIKDLTTGRIYRDAKHCLKDLQKIRPDLRYSDIIQRARGGDWPKLMGRLNGLDFAWVLGSENPFTTTWYQKPTSLNDIDPEVLSRYMKKRRGPKPKG
jgi:hypothetical protein